MLGPENLHPTTDHSAEACVRDYYIVQLKDPEFMQRQILELFYGMTPADIHEFRKFHSELFPDDLEQQAYAARITLLTPYIRDQIARTHELNDSYGETALT